MGEYERPPEAISTSTINDQLYAINCDLDIIYLFSSLNNLWHINSSEIGVRHISRSCEVTKEDFEGWKLVIIERAMVTRNISINASSDSRTIWVYLAECASIRAMSLVSNQFTYWLTQDFMPLSDSALQAVLLLLRKIKTPETILTMHLRSLDDNYQSSKLTVW